uniref:Putative F-box protein n=1 Tax=Noccaea caerulescens TaxID=107243 RepID=A0A1J3JKS2_NOCCA
MPKPVAGNEKQEPGRVFTVRRETIRDGSEAWRPIRCKHAHTPITNGICVGGIIYYGAEKDCNGGPESLVMSFRVKSEEFNAIELPEAGLTIGICHHFVYYQGQPALVTKGEKGIGANGNGNAVIDMWLWNVIETMWEKNSVEIPGWIDVVNEEMFLYFRGSTRTGHLVFSEDFVSKKPFYVVSYDPLTEVLNKVLINGVARTDDEEETHFMTTFLDYAGTTELLF